MLRRNRHPKMAGEESSSSSATSRSVTEGESKLKIDKSGLYDLQQVKRLLDDEAINVRCVC